MVETLTKREAEILELMAQGLTTGEIAARLVLSSGTVKAHSHNIYGKLGVTNRTQAVLRAAELGLLENGAGLAASATPAATQFAPDAGVIHLPTQLTRFVGRQKEVTQVARMVQDRRVRLVTVMGAGGMGKTRLALEVAQRCVGSFADGVCFVGLARVTAADHLAAAIIDALGLRFQEGETPEEQLLLHLRDKEALLVLDNCEHLLESVAYLTALLQAAPGVTLLATSRERLNLSMEVVYVLGGLAVEGGAGVEQDHSEAMELLLERARFVRSDFVLLPADREQLRRICRLTAGMPLALILAAGWLDVLSPAEVADELARGIDILESQLRDLPPRQRSMRATIAASWQRLTPAERDIFAGLAVFRGGFGREAAAQVAGASLRDLQTLVNRSLVTVSNGRYELHELLRQFAEAELRKDSATWQRVQDLHSRYFTNFLEERFARLLAAEQADIIGEINADLDNNRMAWRHALARGDLDGLLAAVQPLAAIFHTQSRFLEAIDTFEAAARQLCTLPVSDRRDLILAILYGELAFYYLRPGRVELSEQHFTAANDIFERLGFPPTYSIVDPLVGLGLIASIRGDYARAEALTQQALARTRASAHLTGEGYACYVLAGIALAQGRLEDSAARARQGVAVGERAGDRWLMSHCYLELGHTTAALGDAAAAMQHYQACLEIRRVYDDRLGMAAALTHMGRLAQRQGATAEARRLFDEALHMYHRTHDRGGLATVLHGLSLVAFAESDTATGRLRLHQALQTAHEIEYRPLVFDALATTAEVYLREGDRDEATQLLDYVLRHPACSQATRERVAQLWATAGLDGGAGVTASPGALPDLATVVAEVVARLQAASPS